MGLSRAQKEHFDQKACTLLLWVTDNLEDSGSPDKKTRQVVGRLLDAVSDYFKNDDTTKMENFRWADGTLYEWGK